MPGSPTDVPEITPEQNAKAMLLGIVLWPDHGHGYWVSCLERGVLTHKDDTSQRYFWPDIDTALDRAANPKKYGLQWLTPGE